MIGAVSFLIDSRTASMTSGSVSVVARFTADPLTDDGPGTGWSGMKMMVHARFDNGTSNTVGPDLRVIHKFTGD